MTRVHAADGALLGEYSRSVAYTAIQAVPKLVINAFLAAEDRISMSMAASTSRAWPCRVLYRKNFGSNRRRRRLHDHQQVAKNFLLTNEVSFTRRSKNAAAMRIERTIRRTRFSNFISTNLSGSCAYGSPRPRSSI